MDSHIFFSLYIISLKILLKLTKLISGLTNSCEKKRSEKQRRKGKYTHLNAELQRTAKRDKKPFLSNQYKEIEEKNRMENTRDLFRKIRDTN